MSISDRAANTGAGATTAKTAHDAYHDATDRYGRYFPQARTYKDTGVQVGKTYRYQMRAFRTNFGSSALSNEAVAQAVTIQ